VKEKIFTKKNIIIAIGCAVFGCLTTVLTKEVQAALISAFSAMWLIEASKNSDGN